MDYNNLLQKRIPRSPRDNDDYMLSDHMKRTMFVPSSRDWGFNQDPLDQGETGHCGGFSIADWRVSGPVIVHQTNDDGHHYYYGIKKLEGEPTGEDGVYTRDAARYMVQEGFTEAYAFADSVEIAKTFVLTQGPLCFGSVWLDNMFNVDENGFVDVSGNVAGGHLWVVRGYKEGLGWIAQNSWNGWGLNNTGTFYIKDDGFYKLFKNAGEIIAAVEKENPLPPTPAQPSGCGEIVSRAQRTWMALNGNL